MVLEATIPMADNPPKRTSISERFGGIQDRFDLIIPPDKIVNISMG
jgi:hypothetical protein